MRNRYKFTFITCCFLADLLALVFGTLIFLRISTDMAVEWNFLLLSKMIPITILSWLFSTSYFRLYRVDTLFSLDAFYRNSWRALLTQRILWQISIIIFQGSLQDSYGSRAHLFQLSFLLVYILLSRIMLTFILAQIKKWGSKPYTVAIWGFNKTSIELASKLETNSCFIDFKGIMNENSSEDFMSKEAFNFALTSAIQSASANQISELYIVVQPNFISDLNYYFELGDKQNLRLKFVPDFSTITKDHFSAGNLDHFHVIKPRNEPLQNAYNRLVKRIFDLVFSVLVIVFVLSWLYPILAFLIKRQSPGPVLFKQLRTGEKNEAFWCYKFRSMQTTGFDASQQARKGDARVTPIGKFIRRTSLDEMPQFFNVLLGNMSVVGPRPHMLQHTMDYNEQINNFMVRHFIKPGITGLAQISGLRGETKKVSDMKRRVNADIDYLQHWSLVKDLKICFLTVIVSLKGDEKAF
ncbi:exopolysaccharide biosynthesis polyprenyl glycosylphosphotransferase [Flavobacterium bomense]|uniref:Exopolysaccharide biosynthesis polyprenyl glycosylphosphotransferase n=1 Tax=Flavobacterium bomense TaxID=2497483 RepID=A0A3S0MBI2_9FLAO|nr:exopolysaccharide biosynthesis polyprenyl glycosylphosphotransferase [Flavobacterium bomense]RTZ02061.1 exopolysaccharide biosynthesis polyprenyl glycosylphosphotransferase [Flavobacterium bomense]